MNVEWEVNGPKMSGRAHVGFADEASAAKLFKATLNEELVIDGLPIRAENLWARRIDDESAAPSST